jgi:hypothetical protein
MCASRAHTAPSHAPSSVSVMSKRACARPFHDHCVVGDVEGDELRFVDTVAVRPTADDAYCLFDRPASRADCVLEFGRVTNVYRYFLEH